MVLWCWIHFFVKLMQVSVVSVVYSQSELLKKEVFLVELVDSISKSSESMSHLKAVYFLRPTSENIQFLRRQLPSPRFGEYHLCRFFYAWILDKLVSILYNLIFNFPLLICNLLPLIWRHFVNPFWNYSFLQHIEGHSDWHTCWFRWTRSCPAGSGSCLCVHFTVFFFSPVGLGTLLFIL